MARLGSSQHAVERHAAVPGRGRSKWRNQQCRTHRRRSDRIDLPTGMVTRRRAIALVSDRSGWWNLYSLDLATREVRALTPMAAEFGLPQWLLGMSTYAFAGPERIVCTYCQGGLGCLGVLDLANETLTPVTMPFTEFGSMRAVGDRAVFRAGAPDHPASIVALDLASGRPSVLKKATDILDRTDPNLSDYLTRVESVEFPTAGGETAFGLFYSPRNPDYAPGAEERPPLLVKCHGGPTSAASSTLNLGVQYWTSRGIA